MERAPKENSDVNPDLSKDLSAEELVLYRELKERLKAELVAVGVWSQEFGVWADKNITAFGLAGKSIESMGGIMEKRTSPLRKKEISHYRSIAQKVLEKTGGWTSAMEHWFNSGSAESFKIIGEIMDRMGDFIIYADARRLAKKIERKK